MKIILIYLLLFTFWAELALGFKLTHTIGLSLFNLCMYLLLFAWGHTILIKKRLFESNEVNKYIFLLSIVVLFSLLIKQFLGEIPNINTRLELVYFKLWITPFILFLLILNIIDDEKTVKATILGLIILLAITATTTPLISTGILQIGHTSTLFEGRAAAFGGPNEFASYLVLFTPLVLTYFFFQKRPGVKVISAFLFFVTLVALVTTGSRGGLLSLIVAIATYVFFLRRQKMIQLQGILGAMVLLLIIGSVSFVFAPAKSKDILKERLSGEQLQEGAGLDEYTAGRTLLLRNGTLLFLKSPIFGHGKKSFQPLMRKYFGISAVAHNAYLTYLVECGILGLIFFLMILIKTFQHARKNLNETPDTWNKLFYISYIAGFCGYHFSLLGLNEGLPRYIFWIYTAVLFKYDTIDEK